MQHWKSKDIGTLSMIGENVGLKLLIFLTFFHQTWLGCIKGLDAWTSWLLAKFGNDTIKLDSYNGLFQLSNRFVVYFKQLREPGQ
jgi:hypothetical protein